MNHESSPEPGSAIVASSPERLPPPTMAKCWPADLLSGFLVFLIALPLCLAISIGSGYPPLAGLYTAIIGGILTTFISNSEMTIKGPAAGLIGVAVGAVVALGGSEKFGTNPESDLQVFQMVLGVGIVAGAIQIVFGLLALGDVIGDFFPTATVQGMLASIGVVIAVSQIHIALGVSLPKGTNNFQKIAAIPNSFVQMNPAIAIIGLSSLLILFGWLLIRNPFIRRIPAPMIVLFVSVALGYAFELHKENTTGNLFGRDYEVGPDYNVKLPLDMTKGITHPNFAALTDSRWAWDGWKYVIMFALVGSLESLLSAKAIDLIDPWRRKTSLNRDLLAIGVANTACAAVGGLPMISEIVRSRANIDNGARTRLADFFHALFLLVCVYSIPLLLNHIPMAALAAMLVYTGYRLASPSEFYKTFKVGPEQLIIVLTTLIVSLASNLLYGIAAGVVAKVLIHLINGASVGSMIKPKIDIATRDDGTSVVKVEQSVVFTNWLWLKAALGRVDPKNNVIIDLSQTRLVDHTVMEKLHEMESEYRHAGRRLTVVGLEDHRPMSSHPQAARKKGAQVR